MSQVKTKLVILYWTFIDRFEGNLNYIYELHFKRFEYFY